MVRFAKANPRTSDFALTRLSVHIPLILLALFYASTALATWADARQGAVLAALAVPLVWASVTDLSRHVIPDAASLSVAAIGLGVPLLRGEWPDPMTLAAAVLVMAVLAGAGEIYWRRHETEALGLGDVKLIGAGILVVGHGQVWVMILIAAAGGILAALLAGVRGERGIPFGPFLAYAIFIVAAVSDEGVAW